MIRLTGGAHGRSMGGGSRCSGRWIGPSADGPGGRASGCPGTASTQAATAAQLDDDEFDAVQLRAVPSASASGHARILRGVCRSRDCSSQPAEKRGAFGHLVDQYVHCQEHKSMLRAPRRQITLPRDRHPEETVSHSRRIAAVATLGTGPLVFRRFRAAASSRSAPTAALPPAAPTAPRVDGARAADSHRHTRPERGGREPPVGHQRSPGS